MRGDTGRDGCVDVDVGFVSDSDSASLSSQPLPQRLTCTPFLSARRSPVITGPRRRRGPRQRCAPAVGARAGASAILYGSLDTGSARATQCRPIACYVASASHSRAAVRRFSAAASPPQFHQRLRSRHPRPRRSFTRASPEVARNPRWEFRQSSEILDLDSAVRGVRAKRQLGLVLVPPAVARD